MIYDVFTLGSTNNKITFNDETNPNYYLRAKRRYVSDREIRQFDSVVPDEMGIVDYQTLVGRSYLQIEAKIFPVDEDNGLYKAWEDIRKVCNPKLAQDDTASDTGYVYLQWSEGNKEKELKVKPLRVDIPENVKDSHTPTIKIVCKIKYPIVESQDFKTNNFSASIIPGSGVIIPSTGLVIPANGITINADTGTGSGYATNDGDYKAYPNVIFTGPINTPRITNETIGKFIEFNYNLTDGNKIYLYIDYDGVTATHSDGTNMLQYITQNSAIEDFYLKEGDNQLKLTATTLGSGSSCEVTWKDSWPLS